MSYDWALIDSKGPVDPDTLDDVETLFVKDFYGTLSWWEEEEDEPSIGISVATAIPGEINDLWLRKPLRELITEWADDITPGLKDGDWSDLERFAAFFRDMANELETRIEREDTSGAERACDRRELA